MWASVVRHTHLCARREPAEHAGKASSPQILEWMGTRGNTAAAGASAPHACLGGRESHGVRALEKK